MAVYKRTYKAYRGPLTPAWSRFSVLSRYGLSTLFTSRPFTAYAVLCGVPFLGFATFIYVVHNSAVQALFNVQFGKTPLINSEFFMGFMGVQAFMSFILAAWAAPPSISKDFANNAVQLYLSRPISRAEYLVGKVSSLAGLLSLTTWIPALVLWVIQAELQGNGWGWENLWIAGAIIIAGLLWIAVISLLSMAIAVWVRWRIAATGLLIAVLFLLPGLGEAFDLVLRANWGKLLNLPHLMAMIWAELFRLPGRERHIAGYDAVPMWSAWAMLLGVCVFCVWILHQRLQAREVERG